MEGSRGTASLRAMAPQWSLAGDKQLLSVLQNIHENVLIRCTETNAELEEMTAALNDASISLQNVNNKLMALSNTQFVESRVYDDDFEIANEIVKMEEPKIEVASKSEMQKIIEGLKVVERMHEPVHIVGDSDSDTDNCDSDDGDRVVLKLKDFYSHRPLPHIIGSAAWSNKWHVGLMPDDSDSDSSTSKPPKEAEEYSDSEPERDFELPDVTVSDVPTPASIDEDEDPPKVSNPADVAAQLSKKLLAGAETFQGGSHLRNSWEEPAPIARSNEPTTSRIFSDEPPPIDRWGSDSSDDEDIFAEIHKNKPYASRDRAHSAARDLFGDDPTDGDVAQTQIPKFARTGAPEQTLFADHQASREDDKREKNAKKPVGGISVFGSANGAEGIKAAITKRNARGATISDNEGASDNEPVPEKDNDKLNEKDIFNDLFKDVKTKKDTVATDKDIKQKEKKIDLFSDNIFDDIDNIFVNKVKSPSKDKKSIFDDIDDLFADVTTAKSNSELPKNVLKAEKGIFDSDDDLFSENTPKIIESKIEVHEPAKVKVNNILEENSDLSINNSKPKSFHNDDNIIEGSRDLHKNEDETKSDNQFDDNHNENVSFNVTNNDSSVVHDSINTSNNKDEVNRQEVKSINVQNSKQNEQNGNVKSSLFDDDEEIDDLFQTPKNHEQKLFKTNKVLSETKNGVNNEKDNTIRSNVEFKPLDSFSNQADTPTDIFASVNNEVVENISSVLNKEIGNKTHESPEINAKTDHDNKQNTSKQTDTLIPVPQDSDYNDIFNDQPPEFEKPTEPKKSKNINALFDDDSDDEALFFKKNDATLDDSPDFSSNHNNLFGIFHDEPPALDVDFVQKSNNDGFSDSYDTLFSPRPIYSAYSEESDIRCQPPSGYKNTQDLSKEARDVHDCIQTINFDLTNETLTNLQYNRDKTTNKIINDILENENSTRKDISSDLVISDDELFNYKPKKTSNKIKPYQLKHSDNEEHDTAQLKNNDFIDEKIDHVSQKIEKKSDNYVPPVPHFDTSDEELFTSASNFKEIDITDSNKTADNLRSDSNIDSNKSIGKLKPMNIKIDVNTLLPGASPKKVPKSDQTDGQTISIQSNEELNTGITLKNEQTIIKSVNFEGDSNSNMLDNKLSKERAKIQIKRRPSTRKARREAVRRSAIDFADDSTDNSSSIDDKHNDDVNANRQPDKDSDIVITRETAHYPIFETKDEIVARDKPSDNIDVITNRPLDKSSLRDEANIKTLDEQSREHKEIGLTHKSDDIRSKEVVNKVTRTVYILNDEDIFSTTKNDDTKNVKASNDATLKMSRDNDFLKNVSHPNDSDAKASLRIVDDDDDDLFKNVTSSTKSDGIKTLGQVYLSANELDAKDEDLFKTEAKHRSKTKTKSLFDDLSDEENELFNGGVQKKSVLNSGCDEDLFSKSKRENRYDGAQKEKKETKSLFGDGDDNDDIFGAKRKITDIKSQPSKSNSKPEVNVNAEPVFEDPLSLFSNRDD